MIPRLLTPLLGSYTTPVLWGAVLVGIASLYGWHQWSVHSAYRDGQAQGRATERIEWVNRVQEEQNQRRRELSAAQSALSNLHRKLALQQQNRRDERIRKQVQISNILSSLEKDKSNAQNSSCNPYSRPVDPRLMREINKGRVRTE